MKGIKSAEDWSEIVDGTFVPFMFWIRFEENTGSVFSTFQTAPHDRQTFRLAVRGFKKKVLTVAGLLYSFNISFSKLRSA